jgi:hypothetical protein
LTAAADTILGCLTISKSMCGGLLQPAYVGALAFGQSFVFGLFGLFGLVSHGLIPYVEYCW